MEQVTAMPEARKTHLTNRELEYFKSLLLQKREEAQEEMDSLQKSLSNLTDSNDASHSSNAHHMADIASDQETIQMYYRLIDRTRSYINQLNRALERIENKTYGICRATGKPIPKERLEVVPHTRYGVEAKLKGLDKM